jgi:hypothetical protein
MALAVHVLDRDARSERLEHALGVVARRLGSITVVRPGVLRAASNVADFTWADATGRRYSIGTGRLAPCTTMGMRPPGAASKRAPKRLKGSMMRPIGRPNREASPVRVAVIGVVAMRPAASRAPVPELPKSSGSARRHEAADAGAVDVPAPVVVAPHRRPRAPPWRAPC